jgi:hypothetical protein
LKRLPKSTCKRKLYNKQVPGHYIQVNVKLLTLAGENGETVRRFQYIATNDVTWVRTLKIYMRHTQATAIDFVGFAIEKFPFRINEISTDNGMISKPASIDTSKTKAFVMPTSNRVRHNSTVRSRDHIIPTSRNSINSSPTRTVSAPGMKLIERENFYNFEKPRRVINGKTPHGERRERL